jgi:hypothetical protein
VNVAIFSDTTPCGLYVNRRFVGMHRLHLQGRESTEVTHSFETSVHIQTTRRCIPEDGNIHKYRSENLKSCIKECFFSEIRHMSYLSLATAVMAVSKDLNTARNPAAWFRTNAQ